MFSVYKISLVAYSDANETAFPSQKLIDFQKEVDNTALTGLESTTIALPASGSQSLNLNGIGSVTGALVYTDASDCTLTLNGNAFTLKAGTPGLLPLVITSVAVTNLSSLIATNVTIMLLVE